MLFGGYVLVCTAAIIGACWSLGDRRPARFAMTVLIAAGAFSVLGTTAIGIVLSLLAAAFGYSPSVISTLVIWALFCVSSLGTAWLVLWFVARAWRETTPVVGGGPA